MSRRKSKIYRGASPGRSHKQNTITTWRACGESGVLLILLETDVDGKCMSEHLFI